MNTRKKLIVCAFLFAAMSAQAQKTTIWHKAHAFITKPANIDTAFVSQHRVGFSLEVSTSLQQAGFDMKDDFNINLDDGTTIPCRTTYGLSENLCTKVGVGVGYGMLGFSYGFEVGHRSASKKRSLGFNIMGRVWGFDAKYFSISNPFTNSITMGEEGDEYYWGDQITKKDEAVLKNLSINGYYVFNNKRFAYPAAYKMGLVQRHTAGSWMVTARYMQGSLVNSPEAAYDSYNFLDCFSTLQASIGGGYSVNFVLWNKDATGPHSQGLRNVTLNLTALPVITLANYLKVTAYTYTEGQHTGEQVSKVWCYPMPNYIGSAAASLTLGRLYFSTQFTYNCYYFRSHDAVDVSQQIVFDDIQDIVDDAGFRGLFHDWLLKGSIMYRF